MQTCKGCRFSLMGVRGDPSSGLCRRYPPNSEGRWPEVTADDWCGEYQSNCSPDELRNAIAADLKAGFSLRQTASRNGTTFGLGAANKHLSQVQGRTAWRPRSAWRGGDADVCPGGGCVLARPDLGRCGVGEMMDPKWRFKSAARWRADAKEIGQRVKWYRTLPQTERMGRIIERTATMARICRQRANDLEAQA